MTEPRPPGPSFKTEWKRPFQEVAQEVSQGLLVHVRSRFERFGDIYYLDNWNTPVYVTRHPDHVHEVLVTRASSFTKRTRDLDTFLGKGLLTSDGPLWRRQRRLIQPAFSHGNILRYADNMAELGQATVNRWRNGDSVDLNREMMELTLSVVCRSILDYDAAQATEVIAHAMSVLQGTAGYDVFPAWMPNPVRARKKRAVKALDALIFSIIDDRQKNPGADLVSQLLRPQEGEAMDRQQLRDELVTLFLAGHETTALAMTWAFFLLAKNPVQEKLLHDELSRVLGDRPPRYEDLENLIFTRSVVQEAMRFFPPLYLLPRVAAEDTELAGYPLKAGSEVLLWIYFMHQDDRWFHRAAQFRPHRFIPGSGEILHPHAYAPFGAGPRMCIGHRFAMVEAELLLAAIAQRFRLVLAPGQDIKLNPRVTLGPSQPILMTLEAR